MPNSALTRAQAFSALERVTDGFVAFDAGWNYTYVNRRAAEMLGRPAEELLGNHIWTLFPEGVGQPFHLAYERAMKTQEVVVFEDYYAPWDRWFENRCYPSPDGLSIFFSEVTARRRADAANGALADRMARAEQAAQFGVWEWRAGEDRVEWSPGCHRLSGREGVESTTLAEFLTCTHPEGRESLRTAILGVVADGRTRSVSHSVVRPDGEERAVETQVVRGSTTSVLGITRDVTRQATAEQRLHAADERFAATFEHAPVGMMVTNTDEDARGQVTELNRAAAEITGYEPEELIGRHFTDLIAPGGLEEAQRIASEREAGDTSTFDIELPVRRKDGAEAWISARASIVRDAAGTPLHGLTVIQDISARRRAEAERESLSARLRQAERLESLGRLTGGIAHDFNNILAIVQGYSEMLATDLRDQPTLREDALEIHRAAARATALTRQLLLFSDRDSTPETVDTAAVVREMETLLRGGVADDVELVVDVPAGVLPVALERAKLEQVLLNLVVNAGEAMPAGGRVEVALESLGPTTARLRVSDTGDGMSEEVARQVFDPFFTTKEKQGSGGLGLATVYGIVTAAGGTVSVDSTPGGGATFTIDLPLASTPLREPSEADEAPAPGAGETVLVVEDEEPVRRLVTRVLSDAGYRVLPAADALSAFSHPEARARGVDLLLSDLRMPGMSGRELAEELRAVHPGMRVLFLTGHADGPPGAEDLGPTMLKPVSAATLLRRVREALDQPEPRQR